MKSEKTRVISANLGKSVSTDKSGKRLKNIEFKFKKDYLIKPTKAHIEKAKTNNFVFDFKKAHNSTTCYQVCRYNLRKHGISHYHYASVKEGAKVLFGLNFVMRECYQQCKCSINSRSAKKIKGITPLCKMRMLNKIRNIVNQTPNQQVTVDKIKYNYVKKFDKIKKIINN